MISPTIHGGKCNVNPGQEAERAGFLDAPRFLAKYPAWSGASVRRYGNAFYGNYRGSVHYRDGFLVALHAVAAERDAALRLIAECEALLAKYNK